MKAEETQQLQHVIDRNYARLHRAALAMCGDAWEADELAQETFLVAIQSWKQFRGEADEATWLYGICLRIHRNRLRTATRRMRRALRWFVNRFGDDPPLQQVSAESHVLGKEQDRQIWEAVQALPFRQREVIVLRFVESLTVSQIASALQCPEGTVKSRLHHALARLKRLLSGEHDRRRQTTGRQPISTPLADPCTK